MSIIRQFLFVVEKLLHKIAHDWELVQRDTNSPCDRDCPWLLSHGQRKLPHSKPYRKFYSIWRNEYRTGINTLFPIATCNNNNFDDILCHTLFLVPSDGMSIIEGFPLYFSLKYLIPPCSLRCPQFRWNIVSHLIPRHIWWNEYYTGFTTLH